MPLNKPRSEIRVEQNPRAPFVNVYRDDEEIGYLNTRSGAHWAHHLNDRDAVRDALTEAGHLKAPS